MHEHRIVQKETFSQVSSMVFIILQFRLKSLVFGFIDIYSGDANIVTCYRFNKLYQLHNHNVNGFHLADSYFN